MNEIEALKALDELLTSLASDEVRTRVLTWAWGKFVQHDVPAASQARRVKSTGMQRTKSKGQKQKPAPITLVKDLNLKPKGKKSLDDFAAAKNPKSLYEKCTVAIYYLKTELSIPNVSASHVYTCFKHMKWKLPSDLGNTLSYTASQYGWLETRDMQDLGLTAIGENLIEHDLPAAKNRGS